MALFDVQICQPNEGENLRGEPSGDVLARRLLEIRPGLPIILVTGFSERISEKEILELGVRELASKPLAFRDLGRTIRRVLDRSEGGDGSPSP